IPVLKSMSADYENETDTGTVNIKNLPHIGTNFAPLALFDSLNFPMIKAGVDVRLLHAHVLLEYGIPLNFLRDDITIIGNSVKVELRWTPGEFDSHGYFG